MYKKAKLIDTVRLPPERLGEETIAVVKDLLRDKLEGRIDKTLGSIIAVTDVLDIGEGRILAGDGAIYYLSLIHISEPTRLGMISYAVFCLKKKKKINK